MKDILYGEKAETLQALARLTLSDQLIQYSLCVARNNADRQTTHHNTIACLKIYYLYSCRPIFNNLSMVLPLDNCLAAQLLPALSNPTSDSTILLKRK